MGNAESGGGKLPKRERRNSTGNTLSLSDFTLPGGNFVHIIGEGSFSKVTCMKRKGSSHLFAIKSMQKEKLISHNEVPNVMNELDILATLPHTHFVVNLYYAFQDKTQVYMCTNLMLGGSLNHALKKIIRRRRQQNLLTKYPAFCPEVVQHFAAQLVLALQFLHSHRIVHRDIKPDNLLLDHNGHLRITDVNVSMKLGSDEEELDAKHEDGWGTNGFRAPEIYLRRGNGIVFACDWWSAGSVLFLLITAELPFVKKHSKEKNVDLVKRMQSEKFPRVKIKALDRKCHAFCQELLRFDPSTRLGCQFGPQSEVVLLTHDYFQDLHWDKYESGEILHNKVEIFGEKIRLKPLSNSPPKKKDVKIPASSDQGLIQDFGAKISLSSKASSKLSYSSKRPRVSDLEFDTALNLNDYVRNFDKSLDYKAVHAHIKNQFGGINTPIPLAPAPVNKNEKNSGKSGTSEGKNSGSSKKKQKAKLAADEAEKVLKKFYFNYELKFKAYFHRKAQLQNGNNIPSFDEDFAYSILQLVSSMKPKDIKQYILSSDETELERLCREMKDFREDYFSENQRYIRSQFEADELRNEISILRRKLSIAQKKNNVSEKVIKIRKHSKGTHSSAQSSTAERTDVGSKANNSSENQQAVEEKLMEEDKFIPTEAHAYSKETKVPGTEPVEDVDMEIYDDLEKYRLRSDTESGGNSSEESEIEILYDPKEKTKT